MLEMYVPVRVCIVDLDYSYGMVAVRRSHVKGAVWHHLSLSGRTVQNLPKTSPTLEPSLPILGSTTCRA
jgi:hypothetical protein